MKKIIFILLTVAFIFGYQQSTKAEPKRDIMDVTDILIQDTNIEIDNTAVLFNTHVYEHNMYSIQLAKAASVKIDGDSVDLEIEFDYAYNKLLLKNLLYNQQTISLNLSTYNKVTAYIRKEAVIILNNIIITLFVPNKVGKTVLKYPYRRTYQMLEVLSMYVFGRSP